MHERFEQAPIIREERASFGPPALIKLTRATSLAPKWQTIDGIFKNESFIKKDKHFT